MQEHLVLTLVLLGVCFSVPFLARGQDPQPQQSKAPAKIELGVHFSSISIGPQISPFFDFNDQSHSEVVDPPFFILRSHFARATHFSLDVGGVLEFYASPRVFARFDAGDTMIRYGPTIIGFIPETVQGESVVTHQLQLSAGVGFRF